MPLSNWPSLTDDSGTKVDGTIIDKSVFDAIKASVEDDLFSAANPSITAENIIDEVKTARGSKASLDARLDVSLEENGDLKSQAGLVTLAQAKSLPFGSKNLVGDSRFMLWPDGDSAAPDGWVLSGAGASVARAGTGLGDTTTLRYSAMCVKLTRAAADAVLTKALVPAASFSNSLRNRKVTVGIACKSGVVSSASVIIDDGVTQTRGGQAGNGTWHTGGNTEEWLYATHTLSGTATKIDLKLEVAGSASSSYFGAIVFCVSDIPLLDWFPERWGWLIVHQQQRGTATVGTAINEFRHDFEFPCLLYKTRLKDKTAPTGQAIIVDVNKDGTTAYTTKPQIAAGATTGNARPDGTYANRCMKQGSILTWDIDQVGSGTIGEEVNAEMFFYVPMPDMDALGV